METAPTPISPWLWVLVPVLFFTIFPLFWCFVVWLISQIGGWQRLARRYRTNDPMQGTQWTGQYGMVGVASYKGTLHLATTPAGLYMQTSVFFRVGHPRLFIRWEDMHEAGKFSILWMQGIRVRVGQPVIATLSLPEAVMRSGPVLPPPLPGAGA